MKMSGRELQRLVGTIAVCAVLLIGLFKNPNVFSSKTKATVTGYHKVKHNYRHSGISYD